jgi:hypothetical protein
VFVPCMCRCAHPSPHPKLTPSPSQVQLDAAGGGPMLAKLGWELERDRDRGWWRTSSLAWQDFREGFRPGIGREEWTRAYG